MWRDAGPARGETGLARLEEWLEHQRATNPVLVARMIAAAARRRTESRGAHRRRDFPREDPALAYRMRCHAHASIP